MTVVLRDTSPVARVEHRCAGCERTIQPGEKYRSQVCVNDGRRYTWKSCDQCIDLANDLWREDVTGGDYDDEYPYLPDIDWHDVTVWSPLWAARAAGYRAKWTAADGSLIVYPRPVRDPEIVRREQMMSVGFGDDEWRPARQTSVVPHI